MSQAETALKTLSSLRRPRLLIRAARFGLADYNRDRDLKRLMRVLVPPPPERALSDLLAAESEAEARRTSGAAGYCVARHVELLIALMGESLLVKGRMQRDTLP